MAGLPWADCPRQLQLLESLVKAGNLTWAEIAKTVSKEGAKRSGDSCRSKASLEGWSAAVDLELLTDEQVAEYVDERVKVVKSEALVRHYKSMYTTLVKQQADVHNLVERMKDSLESIKPMPPMKIREPIVEGQEEEEVILLVSDIQLGTKSIGAEIGLTEPRVWGAFGAYDFNVFRYKLRVWLKAVLKFLYMHRASTPVKRLHLWFLGDVLENEWIYRGQGAYIETGLIQQYYAALYEIGQVIAHLSTYFEEIEIHGVPGNHGRGTKRPRETKTWVNWEWLWYRYLELVCGSLKNVKFDLAMSWYDLPMVMGHRFLLLHGEDIKRYMRFPWYSTERMEKAYGAIMERVGTPFEYLCFGHHHVGATFQSSKGEWICNGNWVGPTMFTMKVLYEMVKPIQFMMFFHPQQGITTTHKINLAKQDQGLWDEVEETSYNIDVPITNQEILGAIEKSRRKVFY